jgi:8-amino-7-oxononanoate synthase
MSTTESWIIEELAKRRTAGLERNPMVFDSVGSRPTQGGVSYLNFSSNDYLGLAGDARVVSGAMKALRGCGAGATASRLVAGSLGCHERLEHRLAALKGYDAGLLFGSGYSANAGIITAVVGRDDHLFIDRLAHASLVDAAVLSRARIHRFRHNDVCHLRTLLKRCPAGGRRLIVTESVFSMDGDLAPLVEIAGVAGEFGAMTLVDEAHATGVFGVGGSGLVGSCGVQAQVNLVMSTLSKALGGYGGCVCSSSPMRSWLVNQARSFIYSTAVPPAMVGAALAALDVMAEEPGIGASVLAKAERLRGLLNAGGLGTGLSASQIVPVMVGDNQRAVRMQQRLLEAGILAVAIRPPTVPAGTARLRFSVTAHHTEQDIACAAEKCLLAARKEGLV